MRRFLCASLLSLAASSALAEDAAKDPYAGAEERPLKVGDVVDLAAPGIVLQLVCDKVGELIDVDIGEERVTIRALAPGVTACSVYGQQDRDESEDGQRSGVVEYRQLVKFVITPAAAE